MKQAKWSDCLESNIAKIISPDYQRAKSLFETAHERLSIISKINEKNCNFVFEDYYTSINEIIQALAFEKGFNILNHLCLGYFLKEYLKRDDIFLIFDDLRYKRNSLTYYGIRMDFETAKEAIIKSKRIIKELNKLK